MGAHRIPPARRPGDAPFDRWSFAHLGSGVLLGLVFTAWAVPLALLAAFEAVEGGLRRLPPRSGGLAEHESWANIAADLAVGMAGVLAVRLLWPDGSLWF